ncbi:MAG: alpha/beta fold hydrolase [Planctomycetota bacterium]|nr:alpha/beta fold hydrolase [Planctomycetota bacterium]
MCRASLLLIAVLAVSTFFCLAATAEMDGARPADKAQAAEAVPHDAPRCVIHSSARRATPLILVHGNGSDSAKYPQHRWDEVIQWMQANPVSFAEYDVYDWCHDTSLPIGFNGTTGNAKQLADFIDTQLPKGQQVILLAHSRGGLVCRAYMNHNNQGDRVLKLITLGTPHHGSPLAVPDWAKAVVRALYDELYRPGSGLFDTTRVGTLEPLPGRDAVPPGPRQAREWDVGRPERSRALCREDSGLRGVRPGPVGQPRVRDRAGVPQRGRTRQAEVGHHAALQFP